MNRRSFFTFLAGAAALLLPFRKRYETFQMTPSIPKEYEGKLLSIWNGSGYEKQCRIIAINGPDVTVERV